MMSRLPSHQPPHTNNQTTWDKQIVPNFRTKGIECLIESLLYFTMGLTGESPLLASFLKSSTRKTEPLL
jgi:hypothetical protein